MNKVRADIDFLYPKCPYCWKENKRTIGEQVNDILVINCDHCGNNFELE